MSVHRERFSLLRDLESILGKGHRLRPDAPCDRSSFMWWFRPSRFAYLAGVLGTALLVVVRASLPDSAGSVLSTLIFILTVLAAGGLGGWKPGLVATTLEVLAADFFFIEPYYSFSIPQPVEVLRLAAYFIVGVLISALCEGLHIAHRRIKDRQQKLEAEVAERRKAEHASRFLSQASVKLAALVDFRSTLETVAQLAIPDLADWCALDILDPDGSIHRLVVAHRDPGKADLARELENRHPLDPEAGPGLSACSRPAGQS